MRYIDKNGLQIHAPEEKIMMHLFDFLIFQTIFW